ncbi:MAG: tRNA glutamyl-Q(34) synthetase GluQRS [Eubacteriales bacterium]|jgi:glutamyl-tRNA synthetase
MNPNLPIGRFAPTPSGRMHLGNVLCGLLAWLSAHSQHGTMVLRIEDLDPDRCPRSYALQLQEDLRWLGLTWEEGGDSPGPHSPYYQSERTQLYQRALDCLKEKGLLYPCFCSRAQLHAAQAPHLSDGNYLYPGTCRSLSSREIQEKSLHRSPAIRIAVPQLTIRFDDLLYGPQQEELSTQCGDFILRRSDGVFAYQLAVVVDDALMGVTQVVRGRDLLSSTARQIWLHSLLDWEPPQFGHIPLLLAPDGTRLSKRDRALDLGVLRQKYSSGQLLGELAALCGLLERPEAVTAGELIPLFSWDKLPKEDLYLPAHFWQ